MVQAKIGKISSTEITNVKSYGRVRTQFTAKNDDSTTCLDISENKDE